MPPPPELRILMLHGYTQTAALFRAKTRALEKALQKCLAPRPVRLIYIDAPHVLSPADIPSYDNDAGTGPTRSSGIEARVHEDARAWWRKRELDTGRSDTLAGLPEVVYDGLELGLDAIAQGIRDCRGVDGVIGFSQGACAASLLVGLLEYEARKGMRAGQVGRFPYPSSFLATATRTHGQSADTSTDEVEERYAAKSSGCLQRKLKFAVCYSGFRAPGSMYAGFYEEGLETPVLHVLGALDTVVDETRSGTLVDVCRGPAGGVVVHPGGHFVPSQRPWLDAVCRFVVGIIGEEGAGAGQSRRMEEERVEDMDVPF